MKGTWEKEIANELHQFDARCRKASEAAKKADGDNEFEKYWQFYAQWTRTNSDIASTIQRRQAFFAAEMSKLLPLKKLDGKRTFTEFEKEMVFFRDMELCQWCKMDSGEHKVQWDECEIHHVTPYAKGGETNIDNAALVHKDCHPKSGDEVRRFGEWWGSRKSDETADSPRKTRQRGELPPEGTKIKFEYKSQIYNGVIKDNKIILNEQNETYKSFSEASRAITGTQRNGWRDWVLQLPSEEDHIRADHWRDGKKPLYLSDF